MQQHRFSFPTRSSLVLSPAAVGSMLIIYILLTVGLAFLTGLSPLLALIGACGINFTVLLFLRPRLALPFYVLIAGPTLALPLGSSGILARLYIGNVLFALIVGIWLLRTVSPGHKSGQRPLELRLVVPLVCVIFIGFISIVYWRLFPEPNVSYSFRHAADVPITLVNLAEMSLLIGILLLILIVPSFIRTVRDVQWMIRSYIGIGLLYALGTIFAAPLNLYSSSVILGFTRPEVVGLVSGSLGMMLALFSCMALSQTLYARRPIVRLWWGILSFLFALSVVMCFTRDAWIMLFVSVWVIISARFKNWFVLLIPLVLVLLLSLTPVSDFFDPSKVYGFDRLTMFQDAFNIWQRHPFLGVGAGNYQFFDIAYGTDVGGVAHSQYLEILAEMGVPGLLCFLWLVVVMGQTTLKHFNTATSHMGKTLALAYLGFYAGLIALGFFGDPMLPSVAGAGGTFAFVIVAYPWLIFGLVLSIPNWDKEVSVS